MKNQEFIHRKIDHLRYALQDASQASSRSEWDALELAHDSLPDLNLNEVSLESSLFNQSIATPFFIAGMTAGHPDADQINERLAKACADRGWIFGLGSQRRELDSAFADHASHGLKKRHADLNLISNLGIAQLIEVHAKHEWHLLQEVLSHTASTMLAIHLNPIQEAIQQEGTPRFKGGLAAIESLLNEIKLPVILKETGSGMSKSFLNRVSHLDLFAIDVSGLGGTHWGRVEGLRASENSVASRLGQTFENWGIGTLTSVINAAEIFAGKKTEIWASGGVRTGLDAAKCIALGAKRVGFAKPALQAAMVSETELNLWMETKEAELRSALFCTNSAKLSDLNETKINSMRLERP